jgi:Response regulator containing a CheY-like receiver domain and an HTH DNA-binding domain
MEELTPREAEIFQMIATVTTDGDRDYGLTNAQIAEQLGVSKRTVDTHVQNIKDKLGARNRIDMITIFVRNGGSL